MDPASGVNEIGLASSTPADGATSTAAMPLTMQIVLRRDLLEMEGWGVGPLIAQAAHAVSAVLHGTRTDPDTIAYLEDLSSMRKVVQETASQESLEKLARLLSAASPLVRFHLWTEQPENIPTCIALAPNRRDSRIKKALDKASCRLWRT